jgi:hypothetical protein
MKTIRLGALRVAALSDEEHEHVETLLARLPAGIDRAAVLDALAVALSRRNAHKATGRVGERARALRRVRRAVNGAARQGAATPGLLRGLRESWARILARPAEPGRPLAEWRRDALRELRALRVTRAAAEELLEAAGLVGSPPRRR